MNGREKLIALLDDGCYKACSDASGKKVNEVLADYLLANGVSVPSCKVGDIVYQLDSAGNIYKSAVTQVVYNTKGVAFDERAIGKFVFLTREEAEKALAERKAKK